MPNKQGLPTEKEIQNAIREVLTYKGWYVYEAVEYKKDNGWKSQKHKDEWEDVCPDCAESEVEQ